MSKVKKSNSFRRAARRILPRLGVPHRLKAGLQQNRRFCWSPAFRRFRLAPCKNDQLLVEAMPRWVLLRLNDTLDHSAGPFDLFKYLAQSPATMGIDHGPMSNAAEQVGSEVLDVLAVLRCRAVTNAVRQYRL